MEGGGGASLRSLVRPVSPLSRLQQQSSSARSVNRGRPHKNRGTSRSRSPADTRTLASTVHRASLREPYAEEDEDAVTTGTEPDQMNSAGIETRRIIVMNQDGTEKKSEVILERTLDQPTLQSEATVPSDPVLPERRRRHRNGHVSSTSHRKSATRHRRQPVEPSVDRKNTCPILVRLAYSTNGKHNSLSDFSKGRFPAHEIQMNTWIDCSLKELAEEIRLFCPLSRARGSRLHFAVVYPDQWGNFRRRDLGVVITGFVGGQSSGGAADDRQQQGQFVPTGADRGTMDRRGFQLADDSTVTLMGKRFHIGDYIDVAVTEPQPGTLGGYATGRRPMGPVTNSRRGINLI